MQIIAATDAKYAFLKINQIDIYHINFKDYDRIFEVHSFPIKRKASENYMVGEEGNYVGHIIGKGRANRIDLSLGKRFICPMDCRYEQDLISCLAEVT